MQFQNPWGALAFLLVPLLVLLYLLKQRYRQEKVPSTYLWKIAANQWEASHPWQKWRKSLLFFLQLFALCCLILAFMRPVWYTEGLGENTVLVLDVSLSMQAVEGGQPRIEKAREAIGQLIDRMQYGEQMSMILAGHQNELLIAKSADKTELRAVLNKVSAQNGDNTLTEAIQLAKSLQGEEESEVIYLFTDQDLPQRDEEVLVRNLAVGAPNLAISGLSYARNSADDTLSVLGLVQNYAGAELATVELWCDGTLTDVRDVEFDGEAQATVIFEGISADTGRLMLAVSQQDALPADNYAYGVVRDNQNYRVLLQTERNIYLEKAIFLRADIELYKSTPTEALPLDGYDLIIGDGWTKESLPEGQDLWLINPKTGNDWIDVTDAEPGALTISSAVLADTLLNYVDLSEITFAKVRGIAAKDPQAVPLVSSGESALILAQETGGAKRLAFGFDLHDTDLPMKKEFPILVQNILSWFMPYKEGQTSQITAHQSMPVSARQGASRYQVILPDQSEIKEQTQQQFINTGQTGFYRVMQQDDLGGVVAEWDFSVNAAASAGESDLYTPSRDAETGGDNAKNSFGRSSQILPFISILALLIMLVEWWVYHRGS